MKIVKVLFIFALVSMIAVSCKETKKEDVQDGSAVEMTEEGSESSGAEAVEGGAAAAASGAESEDASKDGAEGEAIEPKATAIQGETMGMEELVVPEGVIAEELADTPVIYPGCTGSSAEEIRACNKESFIAYVKKEFNHDVSGEGLKNGDYAIKAAIHVNKAGRVFTLRVTAPNEFLQKEMRRVIDNTPHVTPATHKGEPVGVSFMLPVDFRLQKQ